ncbi:MAG: FAD-dependent oxidoreductase [Ginsengibacter sp.]
MKITIVGAGISGLSTAYTLGKLQHTIKIIAKNFTPDLTSDRAAAFWFPYHIRNDERGIRWCKHSYEVYQKLSEDSFSGITMQKLLKVVRKGEQEQELTWFGFMPQDSYRILAEHEIPEGYSKGYDARVPLIETQILLPWLMNELKQMNTTIVESEIQSFDEITGADLIINCSALGARQLCNDNTLMPIRGQVGLLAPKDNFYIFLDNELPLYIVPRKDAIIIGGTYEEGITDTVTEAATINRLFENAYKVFPELKDQKVMGSWAGIRPYRPLVRVEREGKIIHNYGHGGSGFTLAWGCAEEVASLIEE